jgi:hypothetical protein
MKKLFTYLLLLCFLLPVEMAFASAVETKGSTESVLKKKKPKKAKKRKAPKNKH